MEGAKAYVLLITAILIGALFILGSTRLGASAQSLRSWLQRAGPYPPPPAEAASVDLPAALPGVFVVGHELFAKVSPALSRVLFDGRPIAVKEISPSDLLSTPDHSAVLIDVDQLPVNSSLQILGALIKRGDLVALYGGNYSEGYLAYALGIAWASAYREKFLAVPVAAVGNKLVGAYGDGHGIIYAPTSIEDLPTTLEKYAEWLAASSAKAGLSLSPTTESLQLIGTGGDPCLYMPSTTNVYTLTEYYAYSDGNGYFGYDMCIYIDTNAINTDLANNPTIPITIGGYVYYTPSSTMVNNYGRIMYLNGTLDGAASYEYMRSRLTNSAVDVMGTFLSPGPTSNQPQYSVIIGYPPTSLITITILTPSTVTIKTYESGIMGYVNYTWQYIFSSTQANQIYVGSFADSYAGWHLYGGRNSPNTAVLPEDLAVKLVTSQSLPVCDSYVSADYELIWVVNYWYLYYSPSGNWSAKPSITSSPQSPNQYVTGVSSWSEEIPVVC